MYIIHTCTMYIVSVYMHTYKHTSIHTYMYIIHTCIHTCTAFRPVGV